MYKKASDEKRTCVWEGLTRHCSSWSDDSLTVVGHLSGLYLAIQLTFGHQSRTRGMTADRAVSRDDVCTEKASSPRLGLSSRTVTGGFSGLVLGLNRPVNVSSTAEAAARKNKTIGQYPERTAPFC